MNNGPRVFGDGDLTLTMNQTGGVKVYVGQKQMGLIQKINIVACADSTFPFVEICFPNPGLDDNIKKSIEEYSRELSKYTWIRVILLLFFALLPLQVNTDLLRVRFHELKTVLEITLGGFRGIFSHKSFQDKLPVFAL